MAEEVYEKRVKIGEAEITEEEVAPEKPVEVILTPDEWVEQHRKVKASVDYHAKLGACITPELVADELGLDVPSVFSHLTVMEIDKSARNVATVEGKNVYCSYELINRLIKEMRELE